ncbi:MAG: hypothetical protein IKZ87_08290 [Actinomycetaceae bacterium]|nr:hypothetical protein [Actinomycetaceae bacterium]
MRREYLPMGCRMWAEARKEKAMFISSDPTNPVYLVSPEGDYVRDATGQPALFAGEAIETHPSGYLVDTHGNYILKNNAYIPSPHPATQTAPETTRHDTTPYSLFPDASSNADNTTNIPPAPIYPPTHPASKQNNATFPPQSTHNDDEPKNAKSLIVISVAILLALLLGLGGGFLVYTALSGGSDDSRDTGNSQDTDTSTNTPTPHTNVPSEAYRQAGSPDVPTGALHVGDLSIQSPTGNLTCGGETDTFVTCYARNWDENSLYGKNSRNDLTYNSVTLRTEGSAALNTTTDTLSAIAPTTIPYGTVVYDNNFVCASEENGMTCWSMESGHGFFINRDGYKAF